MLRSAHANAQPAIAEEPVHAEEPEPQPLGISASLGSSLVLRGNPAQSTLLMVLSAAYEWTHWLSTFARVGWAHNAPSNEASGSAFANPAAGVSSQIELGKHVKVGGLAGITVPVGSGAGNTPNTAALKAWTNSVDWGGAMFAVDHVDVFGGLRASYTASRLTLQIESTVHQLVRVRGEASDPIGDAATVTGSQATALVALPHDVSVSTGLAETRFWNTPKCIQDSAESRRDYFVVAGVSLELKLAKGVAFTPGVLYARALDLPLTRETFQVIEVDLGFSL